MYIKNFRSSLKNFRISSVSIVFQLTVPRPCDKNGEGEATYHVDASEHPQRIAVGDFSRFVRTPRDRSYLYVAVVSGVADLFLGLDIPHDYLSVHRTCGEQRSALREFADAEFLGKKKIG